MFESSWMKKFVVGLGCFLVSAALVACAGSATNGSADSDTENENNQENATTNNTSTNNSGGPVGSNNESGNNGQNSGQNNNMSDNSGTTPVCEFPSTCGGSLGSVWVVEGICDEAAFADEMESTMRDELGSRWEIQDLTVNVKGRWAYFEFEPDSDDSSTGSLKRRGASQIHYDLQISADACPEAKSVGWDCETADGTCSCSRTEVLASEQSGSYEKDSSEFVFTQENGQDGFKVQYCNRQGRVYMELTDGGQTFELEATRSDQTPDLPSWLSEEDFQGDSSGGGGTGDDDAPSCSGDRVPIEHEGSYECVKECETDADCEVEGRSCVDVPPADEPPLCLPPADGEGEGDGSSDCSGDRVPIEQEDGSTICVKECETDEDCEKEGRSCIDVPPADEPPLCLPED